MKPNRFLSRSEIASLFIASLLIASFGWYLSRGQGNPTQTGGQINQPNIPTSDTQINDSDKETKKQPAGSLLIERITNNSANYYLFNLVSKKEKYVYTDSDESKKVILPISANKEKMFVIEANSKNEEVGTLTSISLDGKATKERFAESIPTAPKPIIDLTSKKILVASFSPIEKDYGFSLKLMNFDGSNPRIIKTISSSPNSLVFANDYQSIYYSIIEGKKNKIFRVDLNGESQKQVDIDGVVLDMEPINKDLLISLAPFGNATANQSKIVILSEELIAKETKFADMDTSENYLTRISDNLASFTSLTYKSGITNLSTSGDIYLIDTLTFENSKLTAGSKIIGFINE